MLTNQQAIIYLHAFSEMFNEFVNSDKSFKECANEYNVSNDIGTMFGISMLQIALNNFCEQKDEHWDNTNNDDYTVDNLSAYDFSLIQILNGGNYSSKHKIKGIRDSIEHLSYSVSDDLSYVIVDNKETGFNAKIEVEFFFMSFFSRFDARKYNLYLIDDTAVDYELGFEENLENLSVFRLIADSKNNDRNFDHYREKNRNEIIHDISNDSNYTRELINLDDNQIELLKEYFLTHSFNKDNLSMAVSEVMLNNNMLMNQMNLFVISLISHMSKLLGHFDFKYSDLINDSNFRNTLISDYKFSNFEIANMFELLNNYFKIQFIKYYYQNKPNYESEEMHIRNCLCHIRHSMTSSKKQIFSDHQNGIKNENTRTYYSVKNLDDLYSKVQLECFEQRNTHYFK